MIAEPTKLILQTSVVKIVCGAGHSLILTSNNQLFSWGGNLLG
jgi:alpha-tubulin suppressor-like RCC1 family protein